MANTVYRFPNPGVPHAYRVEHPSDSGELDVAPDELTLADDIDGG